MTQRIPTNHRAVLTIEQHFNKSTQDMIRGICLMLLTIGLAALAIDGWRYDIMNEWALLGGLLVIAGIYTELLLLRLFSNYVYYQGLFSHTGSGNYNTPSITYDVSKVTYTQETDITRAFLQSTFGQQIYARSELQQEQVETWLQGKRKHVSLAVLTVSDHETTTLADLVDAILLHDDTFVTFLRSAGITPDVFQGAARLVLERYYEKKRQERWWGRDNLSRRGSLGRELTLGAWRDYVPYTESVALSEDPVSEEIVHRLTSIEKILQARRDSNIVIIAPDATIGEELMSTLQHRFVSGTALGAINAMSLITIEHERIVLEKHDTVSIEMTLREILTEATRAGNMTIVINDIGRINTYYARYGVQFLHIIEEFLTADRLHVIITTTPQEYGVLKQDALAILKRCQELIIEPATEEIILKDLISKVSQYETSHKVICSYQALMAIIRTTRTYSEPTIESGRRFLREVIALNSNQPIITESLALDTLNQRYGLPVGTIQATEKNVLLSLEPLLHQQIVGQDRAISALANTLRRMRAQLHTEGRPFASFLFLGPSGVGKTETAKALALLYYGSNSHLIRLDMSEYSDENSVTRLIGSLEQPSQFEAHLLSVTEGILLLDEFEKAHHTVQTLFLQMLDEGLLTSYTGSTINCKRFIIIATSNAGSDLIAKTTDKRALSPVLDSDVISHIIGKRLLPTELIGRFDEVILFDALTTDDEITIAHQIITDITYRIEDKGFVLRVDPTVVPLLVHQYHDARFGARPIRHAIEHVIEDIIAKHIIRGDVRPGDTIEITPKDIVLTNVSHVS